MDIQHEIKMKKMPRLTIKYSVLFVATGCLLYALSGKTNAQEVIAGIFSLNKNMPHGQLNLASMDNGGLASLFAAFAGSFHSNIIQENRYLLLLDGLKTTVIISVLAREFCQGGCNCEASLFRGEIFSNRKRL